jgi:hypothetical protein
MTSPNKAREGEGTEGLDSLPPTRVTVAGPTPELERVVRAMAEELERQNLRPIDLGDEEFRQFMVFDSMDLIGLARAALSALLPVSDETVEAMGRAWVNNDPFVAPQPSHVLGLKNALTAAINHITGEAE